MKLLFESHKFIDVSYINQISSRLLKFKQKKNNLWNFRCPYCGDSHKNEHKSRGYIYEKSGKMFFICHNCGVSTTFSNFLKFVDVNLHKQYYLDVFKNSDSVSQTNKNKELDLEIFRSGNKPKFNRFVSPFASLKKISSLCYNHPAKIYIQNRKIPNFYHSRLFFCKKFKQFTNSLIHDKFSDKSTKRDDPRIIIPFISKEGVVFGYQGRSLDPKNKQRYITIILDDSYSKIFGLDQVRFSNEDQKLFILEGPFDSMFVENSIAMGGSDNGDLMSIGFSKERLVFVFDNEPRNNQIVAKMRKVTDAGFNIVIFPKGTAGKDINEMVLSGEIEAGQVRNFLKDHTTKDLRAKIQLAQWRRT